MKRYLPLEEVHFSGIGKLIDSPGIDLKKIDKWKDIQNKIKEILFNKKLSGDKKREVLKSLGKEADMIGYKSEFNRILIDISKGKYK